MIEVFDLTSILREIFITILAVLTNFRLYLIIPSFMTFFLGMLTNLQNNLFLSLPVIIYAIITKRFSIFKFSLLSIRFDDKCNETACLSDCYKALLIILFNFRDIIGIYNFKRKREYGTRLGLIFSLLSDNNIFPYISPLYYIYCLFDEFDDYDIEANKIMKIVRLMKILLDKKNCLSKRVLNKRFDFIVSNLKMSRVKGVLHSSYIFGSKMPRLYWLLYFNGFDMSTNPIWKETDPINLNIIDHIYSRQGYVRDISKFKQVIEKFMLVFTKTDRDVTIKELSKDLNLKRSSLSRLYCFINKNFDILAQCKDKKYSNQVKYLEKQCNFSYGIENEFFTSKLSVEKVVNVIKETYNETVISYDKVETNTNYYQTFTVTAKLGYGSNSKRRVHIIKNDVSDKVEDTYVIQARNLRKKSLNKVLRLSKADQIKAKQEIKEKMKKILKGKKQKVKRYNRFSEIEINKKREFIKHKTPDELEDEEMKRTLSRNDYRRYLAKKRNIIKKQERKLINQERVRREKEKAKERREEKYRYFEYRDDDI